MKPAPTPHEAGDNAQPTATCSLFGAKRFFGQNLVDIGYGQVDLMLLFQRVSFLLSTLLPLAFADGPDESLTCDAHLASGTRLLG